MKCFNGIEFTPEANEHDTGYWLTKNGYIIFMWAFVEPPPTDGTTKVLIMEKTYNQHLMWYTSDNKFMGLDDFVLDPSWNFFALVRRRESQYLQYWACKKDTNFPDYPIYSNNLNPVISAPSDESNIMTGTLGIADNGINVHSTIHLHEVIALEGDYPRAKVIEFFNRAYINPSS